MLLGNTETARIAGNEIIGLAPPHFDNALYGILLGAVGTGVSIYGNRIKGYNQAGIYCCREANPKIERDTIMNSGHPSYSAGILCSYSSFPKVRWCVIDTNKAGVFSEYYSYPNLGIVEHHPPNEQPDPNNNSIFFGNFY